MDVGRRGQNENVPARAAGRWWEGGRQMTQQGGGFSFRVKPEYRVVMVSPIKEAHELVNQSLNEYRSSSYCFGADNRAVIGQIIGQSRVGLHQSIPGRTPGSFHDQQPMLCQLAQVIASRPF